MNPEGLFDTVMTGPGAVTYRIGWTLFAVGLVASAVHNSFKVARGEQGEMGLTIGRAVIAAVLLGSYTWLSHSVWAFFQNLAADIYPESEMAALGKQMRAISERYGNFSFSVLDMATGARDGLVALTGLAAWLLALLGHMQVKTLMRVVFNVVFSFGPLLIGASLFGLPTARVWLTMLLEVCCWPVIMAVVFRSISLTIEGYLKDAAQLSVLDTRFLDVISMLVFLSSLPLIVPVLGGRLLGMSALGDLARAGVGNGMAAQVGDFIRAQMPAGPSAQPASRPPPPSNPRRPGDL